jgi:hypothetical protein
MPISVQWFASVPMWGHVLASCGMACVGSPWGRPGFTRLSSGWLHVCSGQPASPLATPRCVGVLWIVFDPGNVGGWEGDTMEERLENRARHARAKRIERAEKRIAEQRAREFPSSRDAPQPQQPRQEQHQ